MNLLKIITILNWIVIAILGFLLAAETLHPTKGGDAAGRGMGLAFYYLAIIVFVVLLLLNLLPYNWTKLTAFGLIVVPILFFKLAPMWSNWKRNMGYRIEEAKPIFEDPERERIARAIRQGDPEKLKGLLQTPVARLNERGELLAYAINESNGTSYKPEEKLECIRLLFQAGAQLDSANTSEVPIHMAVANVGNAALMRLLLEHGADANVGHYHFNRPILFEAFLSYQQPEATVQALLDFGANPNVTAVVDDEQGPVSALFRAGELGRWGICAALLEKGADPEFKAADGKSFRDFVIAADQGFSADSYSTKEDFIRLKKIFK